METATQTLTMLFTDIEGSTKLLERLGDAYPAVLADHHRLMRQAIARHDGVEDGTEGDAFFVTFAGVRDAVDCAIEAQRALAAHEWPDVRVRVRMGLHTGAIVRHETGWVGMELHRAARVGAAAHGGQIVLSPTTAALVAGEVEVLDLGEHQLKDMPRPQRLHQVLADELEVTFPPPRGLPQAVVRLPVRPTPVGRQAEAAELLASLSSGTRWLTLVGFSGLGKTTLAIDVARRHAEASGAGAVFVPLADTRDARMIAGELARLLDVEPGADPAAAIAAALAGRPALAILDNLEQIPGAGQQIAALLQAVPSLQVVATSQAPLRVAPEHVVAIGPLSAVAAVALFAQRAEQARPGFALDDGELPLVTELATRLEGHPLALELAAGRTRVMSPAQLLERLDGASVLRGGGPETPDRHRSMTAMVDWALELLDPGAQALFARLGTFAGGWTLELAEAVCDDDHADVLDGLDALIEHSLVRHEEGPAARMGWPAALAAEARRRLAAGGDAGRWERRHAETMLSFATSESRPGSYPTPSPSERLTRESRNLRRALTWARDADPALHVALFAAMRPLWRTAVAEASAHADSALAHAPDSGALAREVLDTAIEIYVVTGRLTEALPLLDRLVAVAEGLDDSLMLGLAIVARSVWRTHAGLHDEQTRADLARAREMLAADGRSEAEGFAVVASVQLLVITGETADAEAILADLHDAMARPGETHPMLATYHAHLSADCLMLAGRHQEAARVYGQALDAAVRGGDTAQAATEMEGIAANLAGAGRDAEAIECLGAAEAVKAFLGIDAMFPWWVQIIERHVAPARERLAADAPTFAAAGRALSPERAIDRALELSA